jgi:hypothetical protein
MIIYRLWYTYTGVCVCTVKRRKASLHTSDVETSSPRCKYAIMAHTHTIITMAWLQGCNEFTSQFFEVNGMSLQFETHIPEDKYMTHRQLTESRMGRRSQTPTSMSMGDMLDSLPTDDGLRPDSSMSSITNGTQKRDMREKFLKYANKVLRFYAQWDDRGSMFGQKLQYVINYFLQVCLPHKAPTALPMEESLHEYDQVEGPD